MLWWRELVLVYLSQELDEKNTETKQLWSIFSAIQVGRRIGSRLSIHPKASACQPFILTSVDGDNHAYNLVYTPSYMHLQSFYRKSFLKV